MSGEPDLGRVAPRGAPARPAEWAPRVRPAAQSAAIRQVGDGAGARERPAV